APARVEAALAVAKKWLPADLSSEKAADPKAVAWLGSLDNESVKHVLDELRWHWATTDPQSMATFLAKQGIDGVSESIYDLVAREFAKKRPLDALQWAGQLPAETGLKAGGTAFAEWPSA